MPSNHNLQVTWDSSQPNSYFYHPLGTILGTNDDFSMSFDLFLSDCAIGVNPAAPDSFELASGLMNYSEATSTNFLRGGYSPTQPIPSRTWRNLTSSNGTTFRLTRPPIPSGRAL